MASLPTTLATSDSNRGSWVDNAGGTTNLYLKIDEGISAAVDTNDYIQAPTDTNNADYACNVTDMPTGFGSMTTLSVQIRYALSASPPGSGKDTYGLAARVMDATGTVVLAAADSGGTYTTVVAGTTTMSTSYANSGVTAFAYVNTGASKSTWDGAVLVVRQTYTKSGGADGHAVRVSTLQLTGTYAVVYSLTMAFGSFTLTGENTGLTASRLLTANFGSFVLTGENTGLSRITTMVADAGSFALTGFTTALVASRLLTAVFGAFVLTGEALTMLASRVLVAILAAFTLTGEDLTLTYSGGAPPPDTNWGITAWILRRRRR